MKRLGLPVDDSHASFEQAVYKVGIKFLLLVNNTYLLTKPRDGRHQCYSSVLFCVIRTGLITQCYSVLLEAETVFLPSRATSAPASLRTTRLGAGGI